MSRLSDRAKATLNEINEKTNDLLFIADVLEEHKINVQLDNGKYLNPVSAIRTKVDVIWDDVLMLAAELVEANNESDR